LCPKCSHSPGQSSISFLLSSPNLVLLKPSCHSPGSFFRRVVWRPRFSVGHSARYRFLIIFVQAPFLFFPPLQMVDSLLFSQPGLARRPPLQLCLIHHPVLRFSCIDRLTNPIEVFPPPRSVLSPPAGDAVHYTTQDAWTFLPNPLRMSFSGQSSFTHLLALRDFLPNLSGDPFPLSPK